MQQHTILYSTPTIVKSGNDWYVFFRFKHGGIRHPCKYREGINRITDLKERQREADALLAVKTDWLKAGWNPITDPEFKARQISTVTDLKRMTLNEALTFALEGKKADLAGKSYQDYSNILTIIKDFAVEHGYSGLLITSVNRLHVIQLLDKLREAREWSNHRYNMYLGVIRSLCTQLIKKLVIEHNPASLIDTKVVAESNLFAPYTEEEKGKIAEHLYTRHYRLFVFMQFCYYTGIRPKELLAIRIKNVDLNRRVISLYPDLEEETTKTPFIRTVVLPDVLMPLLKEMQLQQYPGDFFLFGTPFAPGKGNRGAGSQRWGAKARRLGMNNHLAGRCGAMRLDFLMPSPYRADRDTVTKLWNKLVKKELGIDKLLYAAKRTGSDDKILAGIELDTLRSQYGHRSKYMTEIYTKALKEIRNSQLREQTPAFTKPKKRSRLKKAA